MIIKFVRQKYRDTFKKESLISLLILTLLGILYMIPLFFFSKDFRDPMTGYTSLLGNQSSLSSTNFDFSPDGQTIVYLEENERKLIFIDLLGRVKDEVVLNFTDLELLQDENKNFKYLQWYSDNKISFIYGSKAFNISSKIYSFNLDDLTLKLIYSHSYRINNYCWSNFGNTLFILEQGDNVSDLVVKNIDESKNDSRIVGSLYISCDKHNPIALLDTGNIVKYEGAIKFEEKLPTDNNLFMDNFNAKYNSFFAVKKLGSKATPCIGFEIYNEDLNIRKSISKHASIPKFVVSENSQSMLVETNLRNKKRLHILEIQLSDDGVYELPDLTRNGCGYGY